MYYMARSFMVHSSLHWTDRGLHDISLWPFAVKHVVWLYNRVPNRLSGLTSLELLTKSKADHRDLLRTHVWGCPAIVLDPKLQNDHKLPKWNRRARVGQFLGYLDEHSSLHWTDRGSDNISLWPFAVMHAVWLYNCVPNRLSGFSPLELLTKSKVDHRDLLHTHV